MVVWLPPDDCRYNRSWRSSLRLQVAARSNSPGLLQSRCVGSRTSRRALVALLHLFHLLVPRSPEQWRCRRRRCQCQRISLITRQSFFLSLSPSSSPIHSMELSCADGSVCGVCAGKAMRANDERPYVKGYGWRLRAECCRMGLAPAALAA